MDYKRLWITWNIFIVWNYGVTSMKFTNFHVEKHTIRGNDSLLECRFDLEGENLYSVKWYKDGYEIFRYIPREYPTTQIFPVPGVSIDMKHSNISQVLLTNLNLQSSGRYRCEVSGEAPSFQTLTKHDDMVTVALPDKGPVIEGGKPRYQIGDNVRINCTSGSSKPAAHLAWFINGDQVNSSFLRGPYKVQTDDEGLEKTILGLEFKVQQKHFKDGDLKMKCLAKIATIYWNSNEESVEGEKPQRAPVLEVKDTGHNSRADRVQASTGSSVAILPSFSVILATTIFMELISQLLIQSR